MRLTVLSVAVLLLAAPVAQAAVTQKTYHGEEYNSLHSLVRVNDELAGLIATELPGDKGWHPANPAAGNSLLPEGLPTFTDGNGNGGFFGLLNDDDVDTGVPVKRIQYDLAGPTDIEGIQILTGNEGKDGRIYNTFVLSASTDNGGSFSQVGYFESDPLGSLNNQGQLGSTLVRVFDDTGADLLTGATNLQFEFYSVDNTGGQYRDPFDGVNPFTNIDDNLSAAFVSPLVWEIDVLPEPSSAILLCLGLLAAGGARRRS